MTVTFSEPQHQIQDGTDAALLLEGWATATVLRAPIRDPQVDLTGLTFDSGS